MGTNFKATLATGAVAAVAITGLSAAPASAKEPVWLKSIAAQQAGHCYVEDKRSVLVNVPCADPAHNVETYYVGKVKYPKKSNKKTRLKQASKKCTKIWINLGGPSAEPEVDDYKIHVSFGKNKREYRFLRNKLRCSLSGNFSYKAKSVPQALGAGWHAPGSQA